MDKERKPSVTIDGGFFWVHPGGGITFDGLKGGGTVRNCIFSARPRWWQLRQWLWVIRAVLNLPHLPPGSPYHQAILSDGASVDVKNFKGGPPDGRYSVGSGTVALGPYGQRRLTYDTEGGAFTPSSVEDEV